MICLKRNKRGFYLCKKIPNSTKFDKPIFYKLNYQPTNSVGERLTLGEDYTMYLKIKCTPNEASNFNNGDKCYVYKQPPTVHDPLCKNADYIVNGNPINTINQSEIRLMKLSGKNENS